MKTVSFSFESAVITEQQREQISRAMSILNAGGVVAFPTETVYGLGADVTNLEAISSIYRIKQRPMNHPLIVHIADFSCLSEWAQAIPDTALKLAARFWPGPLTLILKRSRCVPDIVTGGQDTVGIRVPGHPIALALLRSLGRGRALAAPSANRFGRISPTTAAHVQKELGTEISMILDGGSCAVGLESTIVSFVGDNPKVLRPGGIALAELESVLGASISMMHRSDSSTIRVPGSLSSHYAPTTPLKLCATEQLWQYAQKMTNQQLKTMVITWSPIQLPLQQNEYLQHCSMPNDPESYGRELYAILHQFDQAEFDYLLVEMVPDHPNWVAIEDRLQRASHRAS
ncbi:translation factor SUA5 [Nitrosomonas sp. PY1]|uniref:L-threonylcarbamoyladenylate synthase n=1 Tax=Nitrosomonas sp. PY1 TaxID=1803906 RepID=UPI001FC7D695|nr:L-threonylcarbamoyladenylate synthase [Nitrosomonas sp. PY1]GKS68469.1 translation factor SUA5 [Nitrosomonas sp. PY1]